MSIVEQTVSETADLFDQRGKNDLSCIVAVRLWCGSTERPSRLNARSKEVFDRAPGNPARLIEALKQ